VVPHHHQERGGDAVPERQDVGLPRYEGHDGDEDHKPHDHTDQQPLDGRGFGTEPAQGHGLPGVAGATAAIADPLRRPSGAPAPERHDLQQQD